MRTACFLVVVLLLAASCIAADRSVADYGAVGDGKTDCTPAFQKALDEAGQAGGGIVNVPAGRYRINGNLSVPTSVTLQGTYRTAAINTTRDPMTMGGSVLLAYAGRGSAEGKPFVELSGLAATIAGLVITYPEWNKADVPPVPYPPCIAARHGAENVAVLDCCLLNPYEGIRLVYAARHLVRNVHGYPIKRGIFVDECYDIGRIENVHIWPFGVNYNPEDPYCKWINLNGVAFEFARTDWQYVTNTFCFGYGVGYKFSEYKSGGCNGNFLGIGADCCERAMLVEQAQGPGLLITNGEFVGRWSSTDAVTIDITEKVAGKVSLTNCSFWGPIDRCVRMNSPNGQFTANACNFQNWDIRGVGSPALQMDAGRVIVQGNTFGDGQTHVRTGAQVASAILMGNQAIDGFVVDNRAGARTIASANEQERAQFTAQAKTHYKLKLGSDGDSRRVRHWHGRETAGEWPDKGTKRWSAPGAQLLLPVNPDRAYQVTLDVFVPQHALEPGAGVYLNGKRIMSFTKEGPAVLTASVPAQPGNTLVLEIRCKNWLPSKVIPNNQDTRQLGVAVRSITMKSKGAAGKAFDANTGS